MKIERLGAAAVIGLAAVAGCQREQEGAGTSPHSTQTHAERTSQPPAAPTTPAPATPAWGARRVTSSGLRIIEVSPGRGERTAELGNAVFVHYNGRLQSNGQKFDSSYDRGEPIDFRLGERRVIAGWEEGIAGMKEGEKRQLIIPPQLGYGAQPMGPIPPNSTLVFDVELVRIGQP